MTFKYFPILIMTFIACSTKDNRIFSKAVDDSSTENTPITPIDFKLLAGGDDSCYLYENGKLRCWGSSDFNDLNSSPIADLSLSKEYACAIYSDLSPTCIPLSEESDSKILSSAPVKTYASLRSGRSHVCGLSLENKIFCWGDNSYEQAQVPSSISGREFSLLEAGYDHNCAISTSGEVFCWGRQDQGQVSIPNDVNNKGLVQLSLGELHSCGLTENSEVYCWGGMTLEARDTKYTSLTSGKDFTCALDYQYDITCWFLDNNESFSITNENNLNVNYTQIAAGSQHLCASTSTKKTICWGNNDFDQLEAGSLP